MKTFRRNSRKKWSDNAVRKKARLRIERAKASSYTEQQPSPGTEDQYRTALADHVQPRDYIESLEIRNKVGWDRFTLDQNKDMVRRNGLLS